MQYLIRVEGRWYFKRRVPQLIKEYDSRESIKIALNTDSKDIARERAVKINSQIESYWRELIENGEKHETKRFNDALRVAQQAGFSYLPSTAIAKQPLKEIEARVLAIENGTTKQTEAVLGFVPKPQITLEEGLELYWKFSKNKMMNKSSEQIRKWKNPRKKAIRNFIGQTGNKIISELERSDILNFQHWWIDRIENNEVKAQSANKDFIHLKDVLKTLNDNLHLGLQIVLLFNEIHLEVTEIEERLSFSTKYLRETLLTDEGLKSLDEEEKGMVYVLAELGIRIVEVTGIDETNIVLDAEIPHLKIFPKARKRLKTLDSKRDIPLVGYALDAFKKFPKGFPTWYDKADAFSSKINKTLRDEGLFPTEQHSLYSLRHSFQDRLTRANVLDRVQVQLMGHAFVDREKYGQGAELDQKLEDLNKVVLKENN